MDTKRHSQEGSLTIEACIFLVLFICAFMAIMEAVSFVRAQVAVQHAADQCAKEISEYGYILTKTGINEKIQASKEESAGIQKEWGEAVSSIESFAGAVNDYADNPSSLGDDVTTVIKGTVEDLVTKGITDAVGRSLVRGNLEKLSGDSGKDYLEEMGVVNGVEGLDFSGSNYLSDGKKQVDIVITYEMEHEFFSFVIEPYKVQVCASTGVW